MYVFKSLQAPTVLNMVAVWITGKTYGDCGYRPVVVDFWQRQEFFSFPPYLDQRWG